MTSLLKKLTFLSLSFFSLVANAQDDPSDYLSVTIPPSPEAASLGVYDKMLKASYTGAVSTQIPLYNFVESDLSVPISLSYYTNGFKVSQSTSRVGLGWTLGAGGAVYRTVMGWPDDSYSGGAKGFFAMSNETTYEYLISGPDTGERYDLLYGLGALCYDSEPDQFSISFAGITADFHFNWDREIIVSSSVPISVVPLWEDSNGASINDWAAGAEIVGWEITTDQGIKYIFNAIEYTSVVGYDCYSTGNHYASAWYLSEIRNVNNTRAIFFEYEPYTLSDHQGPRSSVRTYMTDGDTDCGSFAPPAKISSSVMSIQGKALKKIYGNKSALSLLFSNGEAREDQTGVDLYELGAIELRNSVNSNQIKSWVFQHDYSTGRLTLKSVHEQHDGNNMPPYQFYYYLQNLAPRSSNSFDHWGFMNNNSSGTDQLPLHFIDIQGASYSFGSAVREPDLNGSKAGVLTKIKYPTGGMDEFEYEAHSYGHIGGAEYTTPYEESAGAAATAAGASTHLECSNGSPGSDTRVHDSETFTIPPHPTDPTTRVYISAYVSTFTNIDYNSWSRGPKATLYDSDGNSIRTVNINYRNINEYVNLAPGEYTVEAGATWESCNGSVSDLASMVISYSTYDTDREVKSHQAGGVRLKRHSKSDKGQLIKSTKYVYELEDGRSSGNIIRQPKYTYEATKWVQVGQNGAGIPLAKECNCTVAASNNVLQTGTLSGSHIAYKQVKSVEEGTSSNGYSKVYFDEGTHFVSYQPPFPPPASYDFRAGLQQKSEVYSPTQELVKTEHEYHYVFGATPAIKVRYKGAGGTFSSAKFDIAPYEVISGFAKPKVTREIHSENLVKTQSFEYDNRLLKEKKETGSDGKINITKFFYSKDLPGTHPQSSTFSSKHVLSAPIEKLYLVQDGSTVKVNGGNLFEYYNNLNLKKIRALSLQSGIEESSYNYAVTNGTPDSHYELLPEVEYQYDSEGNLVVKSERSANQEVYVWGYNGSHVVAVVKGVEKDQVEALLTSQDQVNLRNPNPSGTAIRQIADKIRSGLPDAHVTSFIYSIGVGVIEITDSNGVKAEYSYDTFDRLKLLKDNQSNMVKQFDYIYRNID